LNERMLTEQLGVSRTPLREAFKVLAAEGLIELLPHRGAIVAPVDATRVAETQAVIGALESLAAELFRASANLAQRNAHLAEIRALHAELLANHRRGDFAGTAKFEQAIYLKIVKYSGNAVLTNTYRQLSASVYRARQTTPPSKERRDAAVRRLGELLAALSP
jgi:DNA-binding GntR family transcriptional regulator